MPAPDCPPHRYATLVVEGRDAATFLQGQLTQDVLQPPAEPLALAALLNPQGRVIATPWIGFAAERRTLLVPAALAPAVAEHLRRFVLRSKVAIGLEPLGAPQRAALEATVAGRLGAEPARDWALALVRAGLPDIDVATSGEWIPQMLNLDLVGAISFRKGCYTGQEIVARTQHLGRIKRRMRRLRTTGDAPAPGDALFRDGTRVGEVVLGAQDGAAAELLAVVALDAPPGPLALADGRDCERAPLPYPVD